MKPFVLLKSDPISYSRRAISTKVGLQLDEALPALLSAFHHNDVIALACFAPDLR